MNVPLQLFYVIVHLLFWVFVIFSWMNKTTAACNLYVIAPALVVLWILPFHIILKLEDMNGGTRETNDKLYGIFVPVNFVRKCIHSFDKSFQNPLTPQGVVLLSVLACAYKLKSCDRK